MKDFYLLTTEHLERCLWFRDDSDFKVAMNHADLPHPGGERLPFCELLLTLAPGKYPERIYEKTYYTHCSGGDGHCCNGDGAGGLRWFAA